MNIALIGYGKMGKAIEEAALKRGHQIVLKIGSANKEELNAEHLAKADVAIEFSRPEAAKDNVLACLNAGVNVISGTTGWNDEIPSVKKIAEEKGLAFLHSSNFSIGVAIFFEINKLLAKLMNGHNEYNVTIEETHHTQKKDAPSGTAITIAEQVIERLDHKESWSLNAANATQVPIAAKRIENVPGTHIVTYSSEIDDIEIKHTAHNRMGFALGAVVASEFVKGRKGVYTLQDVLGLA